MSAPSGNDRPPLALADTEPRRPAAPYRRGAPNVMVVILDDLGFAQLGCYGGDLDTPNLDRLADRGVRFTNFHTTGMCSPTRACVLTGRNHHRVGMGMLPDLPINQPGYSGEFPAGAGTLAEVLRANGYATGAIGKWHLVPRDQRATGPFHMWPTGKGFDRYYGFLNGETNMWTPNLIRDQHHVEPPRTPAEGYHLEEDLADEAIAWLRDRRLHQPERPFLLWYATAAPHAPHQAPREWIDRFAGRFDHGWDAWREQAFARQIDMGVLPADTELSPRPAWVEAWTDIDADRRRLYARMMECFAGFVAWTDHQVGRVVDHLDATGELDNTVVVFLSDNGCSAEGGPNGSWNQMRHYISDEPDDLADEFERIDDLGGWRASNHYPWGWAWAGNTPFRRWKRYTFEGGVRDPLIISWPGAGDQRGGLRHQYLHAVDLMPTVLELVGIDMPDEVGGIPQLSVDGASAAPILADAQAPEIRTGQYFELWGSRAMYLDGWKAVTNHVNQLTAGERELIEGSHDFADDAWALFDTTHDVTESHDLADDRPEKLAELIDAWHAAADANQVLPLDDGNTNRLRHMKLPWYEFRAGYTFEPGDKIHEANGPVLMGSFRLAAIFDDDGLSEGASGVLAEQGDWIAGWALYLRNGRASWVYALDGREIRVDGEAAAGTRSIEFAFRVLDDGTAALSLAADGTEIGAAVTDRSLPAAISPDGAFLTIGYGRPFPVSDDYDPDVGAPDSLRAVRFDMGEPPPVDVEVELARVLRHQ